MADFLCDTHCHLDLPDYGADLDDVILRANRDGIRRFLIPATDLESSIRAVELAKEYEGVFAAVGVHPNRSDSWSDETRNVLSDLVNEPEVVAIGEIGLDFYRDKVKPEVQEKVFTELLELAADVELPVVIHNRSATESVLRMLSEWHKGLIKSSSRIAGRLGVLHSFSDDLSTVSVAAELSMLIGITGPVTFKKAAHLQEVVSKTPLDMILVETDSPYLTPEPHRGRRNEPAYVRFIAEAIAKLHQTSLEAVSRMTSQNAEKLFGW